MEILLDSPANLEIDVIIPRLKVEIRQRDIVWKINGDTYSNRDLYHKETTKKTISYQDKFEDA